MINTVPFKADIQSFHTLPFSKDLDFVGRMNVMEKLDAQFGSHDSSSRIALVGLGGMG